MRVEEINIQKPSEKNFLIRFVSNPPDLKYLSYTILVYDNYFDTQMLLHVSYEKGLFYLSHYRNFDFSIDYQSINKMDRNQFIDFLKILQEERSELWLKEFGFKKGGAGLYPEYKPKKTEIKSNTSFSEIAKSAWLYNKQELDENFELIKSAYEKAIPEKRTIKNLEHLFWNINCLFMAACEKKVKFLRDFFSKEGIKVSKEILDKTNSMPLRGRIEHVASRFNDENYFE